MLFLHPGAPCVYYGTEAALAGGPDGTHATGPGPACREAFPWDDPWPENLSPWIAELTNLRRRYSSLRDGAKQWEAIGDEGLLGTFADLQVLINRSVAISLPIDGMKQVVWSSTGVADLKELPPQSACIQAVSYTHLTLPTTD